jgi:hypothetical protein
MQSRYNIVRHCIAENDGVSLSVTETFEFGKVYNNLLIANGKDRVALSVTGWPLKPYHPDSGGWPSETQFFNNILVGRQGATPAWVDDYAATTNKNVFDHNLYLRLDSKGPLIRWAGRMNGPGYWEAKEGGTISPNDYDSLEAFRKATGQEAHGLSIDPQFKSPFRGGYGRLPLEDYQLAPNSPAVRAGRAVPLTQDWLSKRAAYLTDTRAESLQIAMAPSDAKEDYWGRKLEPKAGVPVGPG